MVVLGKVHLVLFTADIGQNLPRRKLALIHMLIVHDVLHDALGVRRVIDRKVRRVAEAVDLPPEDPAAGGVEGHGPDLLPLRPEQSRKPVLELVCRLVREGDREHVPWRHRPQRAARGDLRRQRAVLRKRAFHLRQVVFIHPVRDLV